MMRSIAERYRAAATISVVLRESAVAGKLEVRAAGLLQVRFPVFAGRLRPILAGRRHRGAASCDVATSHARVAQPLGMRRDAL